jgi:hypothetical protein
MFWFGGYLLHEYVDRISFEVDGKTLVDISVYLTCLKPLLVVPDSQVAGALRISLFLCLRCTYCPLRASRIIIERPRLSPRDCVRFFSMYGLTLAFQGAVDREKAKKAAQRIFILTDRVSQIDPLSDKGVIVSDDGTVDV